MPVNTKTTALPTDPSDGSANVIVDMENAFDAAIETEPGAPPITPSQYGADEDGNVTAMVPMAPGSILSADTPIFAADEISMPRLRLAQGLTVEVQEGSARPGDWVLMGFEPLAECTVIPVLFGRFRNLRSNDEDNRVVLCMSNDALTGMGNPGGICAACPMSQWQPNPKANGKGDIPPPCEMGYRYVVFIQEHQTMAALEFKRSGITTAKYINTMIQARGLGNFGIKLGAKSQKGTRGTYHIATAKIISGLTADDLAEARAFLGK